MCRKVCIFYGYRIESVLKLFGKVLHHWYRNVNYQNLSVEEIRNSVENADTLNFMDIKHSSLEEICDLDFDIM